MECQGSKPSEPALLSKRMNLIDRYELNRRSFQLLGRRLDDNQSRLMVPATLEWTVCDTFAHMAGVADDILAGRMEGVATDPWTEAQVQRRRGRTLSELLDEWEESAPRLEELLKPMADQIDPRLVIDLWTHEQDVRGAVGIHGGDHGETLNWIARHILAGWRKAVERSTLPLVQIESVPAEAKLGDQPEPSDSEERAAYLRIAPYEIARMGVGRRSRSQILSYEWSGVADPSAYIDLLVAFTPATQDIMDA